MLLDSAQASGGRGRWSYIAADPFSLIEWRLGDPTSDPLAEITTMLDKFSVRTDPDLPPFQTGAVGFLGYELGATLERLPPHASSGCGLPDLFVGFYDTIAAFDMLEERAWIIATNVARNDADARMAAMAARIQVAPAPPADPGGRSSWRFETPRAEFETNVAKTVDYIHAGDIYQANISHRLIAPMPEGLDPLALYLRVRETNPAPFGAVINCGADRAVVSASPERFLRLNADGTIETRPIKGTRPRSASPEADAALARELEASPKDRAENLMIADLLRNDLSRVARTGSVSVPKLCGLESFATVHHLVSVVEAHLRVGLGPVDLLRAAFPGGSITGAPKIRAMEIISELECARRGPYCGTIAWIGFDGAMDSSIVIRTIVIDRDEAILQVGGGIVADSDPAREFEETMDKARALMQSLQAEDP
ncbi:MAG: aminodeoxychorismate synthase component I [Rhodospirillales bacterium]|jgi:para-aminobenzoate synthetase component I|nr:aminodeoxychorismate synthase component I [Rhodospirillales bacterium]